MELNVYDQTISITPEELSILENFGLELTDSYMRIILKSSGIRSFENMSDDEIHSLCIEKIIDYIKDAAATANHINNTIN